MIGGATEMNCSMFKGLQVTSVSSALHPLTLYTLKALESKYAIAAVRLLCFQHVQ
jgi:hypothetical protein